MRERRIIALALLVAVSVELSAPLAGNLAAAGTPAYTPEGETRW